MNAQTLTFTASEQTLTKTDSLTSFASNTVSYIEATFTLGDNWTGYDSVRAVWKSDYYTISTVLDSNYTVVVPTEVLVYKSKVYVNLVGSIASGDTLTDRLTTFPVLALTVTAKAQVSGTETAEVTASQFEQFVASVETAAESVTNYSYDSEAWAVGTRGGVAVTSGDDTYENNSKYWAEQSASELSDLKADIDELTGVTSNLFNDNQLDNGTITNVTDHEFSGTSKNFRDFGAWSIVGGFEADTQYTISLSAKIGTSAGTSNGLKVDVTYTDSTTGVITRWARNTTSYTEGYGTTESGKTVASINFAYSNGYGDTWYVKDVQVQKGTYNLAFIPSATAFDREAIRVTNTLVTSDNMASTYSDFDDFPINSIVGVNATALNNGIANAPDFSSGMEVITFSHVDNDKMLQYAIPFNFTSYKKLYVRSLMNNAWTDWWEINTDPNYSGYDLFPTGDQTNRETEIDAVLSAKKICRLAPGDYYVNVLVLYEGSALVGCGHATQLIRLSDSTYNYMVRLRKDCKLKDVALVGASSDITVADDWDLWADPAGICAVRIQGNGSDDSQRFRAEVSNVFIERFAGSGIYMKGTGYNSQAGCHIEGVFVRNCNCGIALGAYAEYHRITGCHFAECYYGMVNMGGNNVICNCDFSKNVQGLLMDNSSGDYNNNSHGSFIGCTFNHNNENEGTAIQLDTMRAGEMFVGCNIFYGAIILTSSQGIVFSACNIGSQTPITITDGGAVVFNNCIFRSEQTTVTDNRPTKTYFNNCCYLDGTAIDGTPQ